MRKKLLLFLALIACTGIIRAQNEFVVATQQGVNANNINLLMHVSPNGKYGVGRTMQNTAAFWDVEANTVTSITDANVFNFSVGNKVTDEGIVIGNFPDPNYPISVTNDDGTVTEDLLISAGVWKDGEWTSLGLGDYAGPPTSITGGSAANSISLDGKVISGYTNTPVPGATNLKLSPYSWTYNDGVWEGQAWAEPENVTQGSIILDSSSDGQMAAGWSNIGYGSTGIIWKSKDEFIMPQYNGNYTGMFTAISGNGKYAVCLAGGKPMFYDIENDRFTPIVSEEEYVFPRTISNDGVVLGYTSKAPNGAEPRRAFIWTPELGYMDFSDFIPMFLGDMEIPANALRAINDKERGNYAFNSISPDGLVMGGYIQIARMKYPFKITMATPISIYPYPQNTSAELVSLADRNKVEIKWEMEYAEGDETPIEFTIYRNDEPLITIPAGTSGNWTTNYIDEDAPAGYQVRYSVQALYEGDKKSRLSSNAYVMVVDSYDLPLLEDFSSLTLATNFWTTEIFEGNTRQLFWQEYNNAGVNKDAGLGFNCTSNTEPYSTALISKPLDATAADNVYLSFMVRHWQLLIEGETTPDKLFVEIHEGNNIALAKEITVEQGMGWTSQLIDISELAAGKLFSIHFHIVGDNDSNYTKYMLFDDIHVTTTLSEGDAIPKNLLLEEVSDDMLGLAWEGPSDGLYGLTYMQTTNNNTYTNRGVPFIAAHSFDKNELEVFAKNELYLTSISAYIGEEIVDPEVEIELKLAVFVDNQRVVSQNVNGFVPNAWNTFNLDTPIAISSIEQNLKFGIDVVQHDAAEGPIGVDDNYGAIAGKGDLYSEDNGATWKLLSDRPSNQFVDRNFSIIGNVSSADYHATRDMDIIGYEVYRDDEKISNGLLMGQTFNTERVKACFTVKAYSIQSKISAMSEEACYDPNSIEDGQITGSANISIYPNPVKDVLYINSEEVAKEVNIYNISGALVKSVANVTEVNVEDLATGVYVIKIQTENSNFKGKLIKR